MSYSRKYKEEPDVTVAGMPERLATLNAAARRGDKAAYDELVASGDGYALRKAYKATYGEKLEETLAKREGQFTVDKLETELRGAAGEAQSTKRVADLDLDAIWNDKSKRMQFFGKLRELRIHHPDVVVKYLQGRRLESYFRKYLKDIGTRSNADGVSQKRPDGAVFDPSILQANKDKLKSKYGYDLAELCLLTRVTLGAFTEGITDKYFKSGKLKFSQTERVRAMNAVLDALTPAEIARMFGPGDGRKRQTFFAALIEHVQTRRKDRQGKLNVVLRLLTKAKWDAKNPTTW
jgi:hypothetical protein